MILAQRRLDRGRQDELDAHLGQCAECRETLHLSTELGAAFAADADAVPADFADRVLGAVRRAETRPDVGWAIPVLAVLALGLTLTATAMRDGIAGVGQALFTLSLEVSTQALPALTDLVTAWIDAAGRAAESVLTPGGGIDWTLVIGAGVLLLVLAFAGAWQRDRHHPELPLGHGINP